MGSASKMELGASRLLFGDGAVDLGHTEGGVSIAFTLAKRDVMVDQYGDALIDQIAMGEGATIKAKLREHGLVNLAVVFPLAHSATGSVYMGSIPGDKLSSDAGPLIIRPYASGAATTRDITFYSAVVEEVGDVEFTNEGHAVYPVTFRAYLDTSRSAGDMLCSIKTPNE